MKKNQSFEQLFRSAARYSSNGEKCEADVKRFLYRRGATEVETQEIMEVLIEEGFVNNLRYARLYALDKFKLNRWGRRKIIFHLHRKNIDTSDIQLSINQFNEEEYIKVLKELIERKTHELHSEPPHKKREKVIRFLENRGFEKSLILEHLLEVDM